MKYSVTPMSARHVPARVRWLNHPDVRHGLPVESEITLEGTERWLNRVAQDETRSDLVLEDEAERAVAMMGLTAVDRAAKRAELYLFVQPGSHGCGIGGLALGELCRFGFEDLALNRIFLFTLGSNVGAQRFYVRHGFRPEGVMRDHALVRGRVEDRHVFGLLRADWLKNFDTARPGAR